MKLRQLCNHPLLLDKAEQTLPNLSDTRACGRAVEALVAASGKLQLLHKLLPQLRQAGRKLLIFSQMKRMLDLLEDYLALSFLPYERLDGSVAQKERQAAIDRFQVGGPAEAFAFLLSTKVCHLRMEDQISPDLLRSRPPPYLPQISPRGEVVTAQAHREPTPWRAPLQTWHSHHVPLARCVLRQVTALAHISSRSFRHVLATGWARGLRLWKDEEAKNSTTSLFGRYRISPYLPQIPPRSPPGLHTSPPDLPQSSPFYGLL